MIQCLKHQIVRCLWPTPQSICRPWLKQRHNLSYNQLFNFLFLSYISRIERQKSLQIISLKPLQINQLMIKILPLSKGLIKKLLKPLCLCKDFISLSTLSQESKTHRLNSYIIWMLSLNLFYQLQIHRICLCLFLHLIIQIEL